MKQLTAIRLINWYHFIDETIPVDGSLLIIGDNGAGKSTVLDAVQFVLVADLNEIKFNQAATEIAKRSLEGYTRFKLGTEDNAGGQRYERGDCSSFVALEFKNDDSDIPYFIIGVALDSYADSRPVKKLYFIIPGVKFSDISFKNGARPFTTSEFKKEIANKKDARPFPESREFRNFLRGRLGRLPDSFHRLIVKGLAYKPIGRKVKDFVFNFLLDENPVDTKSMQANLAHYKELEAKAANAKKRIAALIPIKETLLQLERERGYARVFTYLILRANEQACREEIVSLQDQEKNEQKLLNSCVKEIESLEDNKKRLENQIEINQSVLFENPNYVQSSRIEADISNLKDEVNDLSQKWQDVIDRFERHAKTLPNAFHRIINLTDNNVPDIFMNSRDILCLTIENEHNKLLESWLKVLASSQKSAESKIEFIASFHKEVESLFKNLLFNLYGVQRSSEEALKNIKAEGTSLQKDIAVMKGGGSVYAGPDVSRLKGLIENEVGVGQVSVLCDIIEIVNEEWQNAVEGYLNTRRFDLIVNPDHFDAALSLYERSKRSSNISGVGLVNTKEVEAYTDRQAENSLAKMVTTRDKWARGYINVLIGDLICCQDEKELKFHKKSITASCMVYQNYAARQTPFHIYDTWYIGERGKTQQLRLKEARLEAISRSIIWIAERIDVVKKITEVLSEVQKDTRTIEERINFPRQIKEASQHISSLEEDLKNIDLSQIKEIKDKLELLKVDLQKLEKQLGTNLTQKGGLDQKLNATKTLLHLKNKELTNKIQSLELEFPLPADTSSTTAEERKRLETRYQEERKEKENSRIIDVFSRQRTGIETKVNNLIEQLISKKADYNNTFSFNGAVAGDAISEYLEELSRWERSLLPEHEEKIVKAKDNALQQLAEDVVHKLRENLSLVKRQFDELNGALKEITIGSDKYKFTHKVRDDYRDFYQMVTESAMVERDSLFEAGWKNTYRSGPLEELFQSLVSGNVQKITEEIEKRADYREYFDYDVEITHEDGQVSLLSRVGGEKSGGETQTAYYIAMLASMYRIYRLKEQKKGTIGIVMFDEAFNNMDERRIAGMMRFSRELGMQLILAAPKERCDLIVPHVTSCSLIINDVKTRTAIITDFRKDTITVH